MDPTRGADSDPLPGSDDGSSWSFDSAASQSLVPESPTHATPVPTPSDLTPPSPASTDWDHSTHRWPIDAEAPPGAGPAEQPESSAAPTDDFQPPAGQLGSTCSPESTLPQARAEPGEALGVRTRLGAFLLLNCLGRGTQGVVWSALQEDPIVRSVALKILPPEWSISESKVARLWKEACRLARLRSEAILPLYEFGQADGFVYFAMQLVEGFNLAQVIDQRRKHQQRQTPEQLHRLAVMPDDEYDREIATLLARVARALHAAHSERLVHRDVKPSNILLEASDSGSIFLSDFGLARDLDDVTRDASRQGLVGTVIYMAPEKLARGEGCDECLCDIYSTGVTLFEAVTLSRPFSIPRAAPPATWPACVLSQEIRRPRSIRPAISRDLEAIILKAVDPEPTRRYTTALDLANDLDRFAAGEPVSARPPGSWHKLARKAHRARSRIVVSSAAAALVAMPVAIHSWQEQERGRRLEALASEVEHSLASGQTEAAIEGAARAIEIRASHPVARRVVDLVSRAVVAEARSSDESADLERALHWHGRLAELEPQAAAGLGQQLELQPVEIVSDPPGAQVTLHFLRADGAPRPGKPAYEIQAGSPDQPARLPGLIENLYWVTAIDPGTGAFVEGPRRITRPYRSTDPVPRLVLKPMTSTEGSRDSSPMVFVPGGEIRMGDDDDALFVNESPSHTVFVNPFYLDATEVTNADYFAYLQANFEGDSLRRKCLGVWGREEGPEAEKHSHPVTRVRYVDALAYAAWRGCRLPTEFELEWAARGSDRRMLPPGFPEGLDPPHQQNGRQPQWARIDGRWLSLHPVGSLPEDRVTLSTGRGDATIFGLFANAAELTLLRFRPYPPDLARRADSTVARRSSAAWNEPVVRSGLVESRNGSAPFLLGYLVRARMAMDDYSPMIGFRCARSLEPWTVERPAQLSAGRAAPPLTTSR